MTASGSYSAAMAANTLTAACHKASKGAGWWTDKDGKPLQDNPYAFSNKLCLIHSEISEALEADRKDLMDDHLPTRKGRECELADALIRIFDLGGAYGMDLGGAIAAKMEYNRTRQDHSKAGRAATGGKSY